MKAEDLNLSEIIELSEGKIDLHGRRLVLHSIDAVAQFRRDLVEMMGIEQARRVFTRFGNFCGRADAAAMKRIFKWASVEEWLKAGSRMHSLQGVVRVVTKKMKIDEGSHRFHMEVIWHDSSEAEEHLLAFGKSEEPICWMLVGYSSGYASYCLGHEVYFIENKCKACGSRICSAVGKDKESWGAELLPYLPYYEADDIHGKVLSLTRELKKKMKELVRSRRRIQELERVEHATAVEVRSQSFQKVLEMVSRVARYDSSVIITGESGSGKEVLARHIHRLSPRADSPFIAVNCGALPETLLESELFGHKAGAFTGAIRDRVGLLEEAQKGTLLLDEVGEISTSMQVKLLRVLQEREVVRVGANKPRRIDIRVISATNQNLKSLVKQGLFREDLYYRLGVIEVEMPSLRNRREDILPLARYFVTRLEKRLAMPGLKLDAATLDHLVLYAWPGNVRELKNALERAAVLCKDMVIRPEDLPPVVIRTHEQLHMPGSGSYCCLAEIEADHIRSVLESMGNNRRRTAQILGISTTTLWRKLKALQYSD